MTDIRDAESAYMEGRIVFLEWAQDFMKEWYAPLYKAQLATFLANLAPNEMKLPGMDVVLPVAQQLLGGNYASTSTKSPFGVPWSGANQNGNRPAPPISNG